MTYTELRQTYRNRRKEADDPDPRRSQGPKAKAEIVRARVARLNEVDGPFEPADLDRRTRCENNLALWLRTYMPYAFYRPFSDDQHKVIARINDIMLHSGMYCQAMPRGTGKTTITEGAILFGVMNGHIHYPVIFGSEQGAADAIRKDLIKELSTNDLLLEDYPEVCKCFRAIDGNFHRCARQTVGGKLTYISITGNTIVFPDHQTPHMRCSGSIIEAFGITSSFRGRKFKRRDGSVIRPDFAFLDDPQTRESAGSLKQTNDREKIIKGDILGLAGHDRTMAAVAAVTVIYDGDLADRMLDHDAHPEWQGLRTRLVYRWPDDAKAWEHYRKLWEADLLEGLQDTPTATAYYLEHREAMDAGAVVSSEHQYAAGEISAIQHAYHLLFSMGKAAYEAEYSNQPMREDTTIYTLTASIVASRCNGLARLQTRAEHVALVAFTDINYSALHWTIAGLRMDFTMDTLAYGLTPSTGVLVPPDTSQTERVALIYAGLCAWYRDLMALKMPFARIGVDAGFEPETVRRFVEQTNNAAVFASRGFAAQKYLPANKTVVQRFEQCHLAKTEKVGKHICFNADYWREVAQRAFLPDTGAPGSCSLYGSDPKIHRHYAEQIVAEQLADKVKGATGMFYKWVKPPGTINDWLDSHVGCYVAGATLGLTTAARPATKRYVERRKTKVRPQ